MNQIKEETGEQPGEILSHRQVGQNIDWSLLYGKRKAIAKNLEISGTCLLEKISYGFTAFRRQGSSFT